MVRAARGAVAVVEKSGFRLPGRTVQDAHDWLASLPYAPDPDALQVLWLPWWIGLKGLASDCKSTAVFMVAWAHQHGIPAELAFIDQTGNGWDHVYARLQLGGRWVAVDPLLPFGAETPHLKRRRYRVH